MSASASKARLDSVIFDLDGTLVHSAPDIAASTNAMLEALGREALPLAQVIGYVGHGVSPLIARALAATGGGADDASMRERALGLYREHYRENLAVRTAPYEDVPEVLDALAGRGLRLGLCTNKPEAMTHRLLAALDLARFFSVVVGGDTLAARKPDPAPLLLSLERLGAAPGAALFVGDSDADEGAARQAGVPFAFHTEGYAQGPTEDYVAEMRFDRWDAFLERVLERGVTA
ncbi:MAG: phosphoglycolate phosphatase [Pseudomonadota bacterium]